MTVKEALDILKEKYINNVSSYPYTMDDDNGTVNIDSGRFHVCLDWDCIDLHTVEKFHFVGNMLDLDNNGSLNSLDGLVFDGNCIRAYGTGIYPPYSKYIRDVVRKDPDDS